MLLPREIDELRTELQLEHNYNMKLEAERNAQAEHIAELEDEVARLNICLDGWQEIFCGEAHNE